MVIIILKSAHSTYSTSLLQLTSLMLEKSLSRRPFIDTIVNMFPKGYQLERKLDIDGYNTYRVIKFNFNKKTKKEQLLELEFKALKDKLCDPNPTHFLQHNDCAPPRVSTAIGMKRVVMVSHGSHHAIRGIPQEGRAKSNGRYKTKETQMLCPSQGVNLCIHAIIIDCTKLRSS